MSVCHILHKYYKERIEADLTIEQLCELFRELDIYHGIDRDGEKPIEEPQRATGNRIKKGEIRVRCDKG